SVIKGPQSAELNGIAGEHVGYLGGKRQTEGGTCHIKLAATRDPTDGSGDRRQTRRLPGHRHFRRIDGGDARILGTDGGVGGLLHGIPVPPVSAEEDAVDVNPLGHAGGNDWAAENNLGSNLTCRDHGKMRGIGHSPKGGADLSRSSRKESENAAG